MADLSRVKPARLRSVGRIFNLTLGQILWSRRSIFLALLVGGPVALSLLIRLVVATLPTSLHINGATIGGPAIFGIMMWVLYVRFIVPVLGVFYGTALIADEVDDKTITYLFTRPIPRHTVLLGKYIAYLVCTALLVMPSVVLVYFLIVPLGGGRVGPMFPLLLADLGLLVTGLAAYGAVFALVGARFKRPLVPGLIFALGWEPGVSLFPGYLRRFTVSYYLQGLLPHRMPEGLGGDLLLRIFPDPPAVFLSLASLAILIGVTLWLAMRTVDTREYVLEQ